MWFTFDVGEDCREVSICPDWLPESDAQAEGYLGRYTNGRIIDNEGEWIAYCIESFNGEQLRGMKYFLTGESRIVKEDIWNGYDRMEIETSYESSVTGERWTAYNLLLFSPEYGCLIRIGGRPMPVRTWLRWKRQQRISALRRAKKRLSGRTEVYLISAALTLAGAESVNC